MILGIIGCGAIGSDIALFADELDDIETIYLYDKVKEAENRLAGRIKKGRIARDIDELIERSDVVFECASQEAVYQYSEKVLRAGKDLVIMSIGALLDDELRERLVRIAKEKRCKIYLPSGALCGIDGISAARIGGLSEVTLVTTKPPESFGRKDEERVVLYHGPAREAVKLFPQNINVAACVSLAGIGSDKTEVKIVSDPVAARIHHKVLAHGRFGRLRAEVENMPNPKNPKSSYLASLSAMAILKRIIDPIQIG